MQWVNFDPVLDTVSFALLNTTLEFPQEQELTDCAATKREKMQNVHNVKLLFYPTFLCPGK